MLADHTHAFHDGIDAELAALQEILSRSKGLNRETLADLGLLSEALAETSEPQRFRALGPAMIKVAAAGLVTFPAAIAPLPAIAADADKPTVMAVMTQRPATRKDEATVPLFPFNRPAKSARTHVVAPAPAIARLAPQVKAAMTEKVVTVTTKRGQSTTFYQVSAGDTLYSISRRLLGSGRHWREIYAANQDRIPGSYTLTIGSRLLIPSTAFAPAVQMAAEPAKAVEPAPVKTAKAPEPVKVAAKPTATMAAVPALPAPPVVQPAHDHDTVTQAAIAQPSIAKTTLAQMPKPQATKAEAPKAAAANKAMYRVAFGDSLYSIAAKRLGNGERWREIVTANKASLQGRTVIYPNQWLIMPTNIG